MQLDLELTLRYITFMSEIGQNEDKALIKQKIQTLFTIHVVKIENGKEILLGQTALEKQLYQAQLFAYPWHMEILDMVCDHAQHTSAVRFSWNSEKVGLHITTAILKFDLESRIFEINEVYNKFADLTH